MRAKEIKAISKALVGRSKKEDQVHIFQGDMNIESKDGIIMKALKDSGLTVPEFGPTNMKGDMWFDQIAFTVKGKATRKTRLLRHNKFDWRYSVFGPHPIDEAVPFTDSEKKLGMTRLDLQAQLDHYEDIVTEVRAKYDKDPYKNFSKSYRGWTTHEMSDHLPIWVELETDYSDDYLRKYLKDD
ncbi:hypothetical protein [Winogradskyella sp. PG-2]|uniref:hypothetical protein n=1 Tax=Winogradskyella sp. PG-2 TaxID=754409 RepID=UPI00045880BA|nr:hypothetical protein [Winogradskyella sp. PG-2]BAO77482.1 endonuclease/exonuclease/phosphatase [Winogradskyella sp. PG-2]